MDMEMRIGRSKIAERKGNKAVTQKSIDSVPVPNTFIDSEVNEKIAYYAKEVLRKAMSNKDFAYNEVGILFSILNDEIEETYLGELGKIRIDGTNFVDIVSSRVLRDLIFIHNHPNNSCFSGNDIIGLCSCPSLVAVVAIGNTSNMYILLKTRNGASKTGDYIVNKAEEMLNRDIKAGVVNTKSEINRRRKKYRDQLAREILNNHSEQELDRKYGLAIEKYNRRCIVWIENTKE